MAPHRQTYMSHRHFCYASHQQLFGGARIVLHTISALTARLHKTGPLGPLSGPQMGDNRSICLVLHLKYLRYPPCSSSTAYMLYCTVLYTSYPSSAANRQQKEVHPKQVYVQRHWSNLVTFTITFLRAALRFRLPQRYCIYSPSQRIRRTTLTGEKQPRWKEQMHASTGTVRNMTMRSDVTTTNALRLLMQRRTTIALRNVSLNFAIWSFCRSKMCDAQLN